MLHGVTRMSSVVEPTKLFPSSATLARAPSWALEFAQAKSSDSEGSVPPAAHSHSPRRGDLSISDMVRSRDYLIASSVAGTRE